MSNNNVPPSFKFSGTLPSFMSQFNIAWNTPAERVQKMSDDLNRLIEKAKRVEMSESEKEQQKISFAYGNTKIENEAITWDTVKKAAEDLKNR